MWRVAIYAREAPGRAGQCRLERQVAILLAQVAGQPGWLCVGTYADQSLSRARAGLAQLLTDAPGRFDVVAIDGYSRLSPNRHELGAILDRLAAAGVTTVVLRPTAGRRFAKAVANFALADLIGESLR